MRRIRIGRYMQTDRSMENIFGKLQSRSHAGTSYRKPCVNPLFELPKRRSPSICTMPVGMKESEGDPWFQVVK